MNARMVVFGLAAAGLPLAASAQVWRFTPQITATETWSDNVSLGQDATPRSGWITQLAPSLRFEHNGPRLTTFTDYRYERDFYTTKEGDTARNYLDSFASYAVVDKSLWLEGRANITQERRSAFDAAVVPGAPGSNRSGIETRRFSLSPVWRGNLSDVAEYQARVATTVLRADGFSTVETNELLGTIRSPRSFSRIGWAVDLFALRTKSDTQDSLEDRRFRASVIYAPMSQVHVSLVAGLEETDFAGPARVRESNPGLGVEWSPGPRTQFAGIVERRFFGNGHLVTFQHRTSWTAWQVTSRSEATVLSSIQGTGGFTMQSLMADLLASSVPDPQTRADAVRRRLEQFGGAPTSVSGGFITERPYLNRGIDATLAFIGVRNTLTLGMARRQRSALGTTAAIADSFNGSEVIKERGYTAALNHRLTPLTSITFSSSRLKTDGVGPPALSADQELETLNVSTRLGPRTSVTLGLRRVDFESTTVSGYRARVVFGSISVQL